MGDFQDVIFITHSIPQESRNYRAGKLPGSKGEIASREKGTGGEITLAYSNVSLDCNHSITLANWRGIIQGGGGLIESWEGEFRLFSIQIKGICRGTRKRKGEEVQERFDKMGREWDCNNFVWHVFRVNDELCFNRSSERNGTRRIRFSLGTSDSK